MKRTIAMILILFFTLPSAARVYRNIDVGQYQTTFNLEDHKGQTFLSVMKNVIYPALIAESANRSRSRHIDGVREGEGVELQIIPGVTTYHVKYKAHWEEKAERSGRSFAGVDHQPQNTRVEYVADASYKHFLSTLEELLTKEDAEVRAFYSAILKVITNSDPSGFHNLSGEAKQVGADFVAVYIAEQYRHLLGGEGRYLGRRHNWDDAHLQVTLLGAFHSGQSTDNPAMYYKGRFVSEVYHQIQRGTCVYQKRWNDIDPERRTRTMNLTDYWQFNRECERSGVNITRRDFHRMGRAITKQLIESEGTELIRGINALLGRDWTSNVFRAIGSFYVNNRTADVLENGDQIVEGLVNFIMLSREKAPEITSQLQN